MLAKAAEAIRDLVCAKYGVSVREFAHGSHRETTGGRWPAQLSVSLARYTVIYELWKAGADHEEAGMILGITGRCARHWYNDFKARAPRPAKAWKAA